MTTMIIIAILLMVGAFHSMRQICTLKQTIITLGCATLITVLGVTTALGLCVNPYEANATSVSIRNETQDAINLKDVIRPFPTRSSLFTKSDLDLFKAIKARNEKNTPIKEDAKFELVETEQVKEQVTIQDNKQEEVKTEIKQETVKEEIKKPTTETQKPVEQKPTPPAPKPATPPAGSVPDAAILARRNADARLLGVLYVPAVNMTPVSVYICESDEYQKRADAANSAYAMANHSWYDKNVQSVEFGDHNNHNFCVNTRIKVGDMAYLNMGDKVVRMKCVETLTRQNVTTYQKAMKKYDHCVVTITCAAGANNRTINKWVIVDDSDVGFAELYKTVSSTVSLSWDYVG